MVHTKSHTLDGYLLLSRFKNHIIVVSNSSACIPERFSTPNPVSHIALTLTTCLAQDTLSAQMVKPVSVQDGVRLWKISTGDSGQKVVKITFIMSQ
jgi:hypothetical protein